MVYLQDYQWWPCSYESRLFTNSLFSLFYSLVSCITDNLHIIKACARVAYTRQEFGCEEETNHFFGIHPWFHEIKPLLIIHAFHRRSLPNWMQGKRIKIFLLKSMSLLTNSQLHHLKTTLFNYWIAFVDIKLCLFGLKNMYKKLYIYIYIYRTAW